MKGDEGPSILMILILTLAVMIITLIIVTSGFTAIPPGSSGPVTKYDSIISQAAFKYGVEAVLVKAVIKQESDFTSGAVSSTGAKGLMQIMPDTAEGLGDPTTPEGKYCNLKITDIFDPTQNINGGTCYLSFLLKKYDNNKELALAAYNAGPTTVDKCMCVPQFEETQNYVRLVTKYYEDYKGQGGIITIA
jgi:soluble lytic murein transglycosylase-like protein